MAKKIVKLIALPIEAVDIIIWKENIVVNRAVMIITTRRPFSEARKFGLFFFDFSIKINIYLHKSGSRSLVRSFWSLKWSLLSFKSLGGH